MPNWSCYLLYCLLKYTCWEIAHLCANWWMKSCRGVGELNLCMRAWEQVPVVFHWRSLFAKCTNMPHTSSCSLPLFPFFLKKWPLPSKLLALNLFSSLNWVSSSPDLIAFLQTTSGQNKLANYDWYVLISWLSPRIFLVPDQENLQTTTCFINKNSWYWCWN